jgi:hypothetical protein
MPNVRTERHRAATGAFVCSNAIDFGHRDAPVAVRCPGEGMTGSPGDSQAYVIA